MAVVDRWPLLEVRLYPESDFVQGLTKSDIQ